METTYYEVAATLFIRASNPDDAWTEAYNLLTTLNEQKGEEYDGFELTDECVTESER